MKDRVPCADCHYCYPIGDGEGLCDAWDYRNPKNAKIVKLFDVDPDCPTRKNPKPREVSDE